MLLSPVFSLVLIGNLKLVPHGNTKDAEIQEIFQVIDFVYLNKLEYKLPIYAAVNLKKVPCFAAGLKQNDENSKDEKIQQQLHEIKEQLNTVSLGINKQNMVYSAVTAKNVNPKLNEIQSPRSLPRNPAVRIQIPPTAQQYQPHPSSSLGPLTHQQHQFPSAIQQKNPFSIVSKKKRQIKNIRGTNSTGMCPNKLGQLLKKKYLETNKFKVISCFEAKSHLGKGFRICIDINNSDSTFTDSALWDEDTIIREWVF
ncbi:hypothetical protein HELRODRAFT_160093 [Helobdella robusta]|uniref:Uncharacterized protein n=1 Tax=Helobdella robusta TaxID=6412 RepID=T1EPS1_HELRO|nr:hypothetical protein HELRODRAFT_160093 [Helobdella robusta]ESO05990.1 hypothetical protein HELRODRAFT_160093 [Helobdella robusta]